jgi:hypothetical protein
MTKDAAPDKGANGPGSNLDVHPQDGGINPSAPTAGTEGWGTTSDERRVLGRNDPSDTRAGQMKGNPGDHMAAASQRTRDAATTNKKPHGDSGNQ